MTQPINSLAQKVLTIAKEAGDKIMAIYEKDFAIYEKQDTSPLPCGRYCIYEKGKSRRFS